MNPTTTKRKPSTPLSWYYCANKRKPSTPKENIANTRDKKKDMSTTKARVCDTCLSCPSTIFCKADLAYLCATCDASIHSANPLARRHQRVPFVLDFSYGHQATDQRSIIVPGVKSEGGFLAQESYDDEAASWFLFDNKNQNGESNGFLFNGDDYLDLVEFNSCEDDGHFDNRQKSYDGIVPVQYGVENETSNGYHSGQIPALIDRKERVLRYMEKKKRRKFEKTIRYACRKAYAETRPRIKGRFAKRTNVGVEVEKMFSMTEGGYCIVPSF